MDMQRLQTFRTVATLMNFNQAAEVLHYSQSTVSAQIKTLENEIGILLFKRSGKSVQLTEAGAKMLTYADKLLAIKEEALADLTGRNRATGLLTLRMPQTVATCYLPRILCEFQPRFPGVRLDITSCAMHSGNRAPHFLLMFSPLGATPMEMTSAPSSRKMIGATL